MATRDRDTIIALVGRPNTGKSSLFNRLAGKKIAITDSSEGTTRDRLFATCDLFGTPIEIADTGGIAPDLDDPFAEEIEEATLAAIHEADGLVLVVDGTTGPLKDDLALARRLQKIGKPLALAVNKVDEFSKSDLVHAFHNLGIEMMEGVSALHGRGIADLLERLMTTFPEKPAAELISDQPYISIVGTPNTGKSTLINTLLQTKRCAVSPHAGTTRDSVELNFSVNERDYRLIDTAGVRKKSSEHEAVDKFAALRTTRAIERSQLCCVILDATRAINAAEKKLLRDIEKEGRSCVVLLNKWDLVQAMRQEHALRALRESAPFLEHCPILFISALTGKGVEKIFPTIDQVLLERNSRVSTGQLNRFIEKALITHAPTMIQGKRLRIYYATQVTSDPPSFTFFVNRPQLLQASYKRYLIRQFRETFHFSGTPIRFFLKGKGRERARGSSFRTVGDAKTLS